MKCPNKRCGMAASRTISTVRVDKKTGKSKVIEGCPACFEYLKQEHIYTGKKIWHAYEAYGVKKTMQMNRDFGEKLKVRAARNRRDNATISEGAYNFLVDQSRKGLIRGRKA